MFFATPNNLIVHPIASAYLISFAVIFVIPSVYTSSNVTLELNAMGCTIKLLGVAKNTESGIEVRVHPMLIPSDHPLATVNDSFNAVFVHGDAVDDAMFYGRGAGEFPTASAKFCSSTRSVITTNSAISLTLFF